MSKITNKELRGYVMTDLGQKIKELRMDKGLTMEEFGKLCNTEKQTVNNWEKGRNEPSPDRLKMIADIAGKSVSEFVYGVPSAHTIRQLIEYLETQEEIFYEYDWSLECPHSNWLHGQVHVLEKIREWENE